MRSLAYGDRVTRTGMGCRQVIRYARQTMPCAYFILRHN